MLCHDQDVTAGTDLAALLLTLKERSGLSYAELARRTYLSSSTLHRYCAGAGSPPDFQTVTRIAQECAATDEELAELLVRWRGRAKPPAPAPADQPPRRRRFALGVVAAAVLAGIVAVVLVVTTTAATPPVTEASAPPWATDPAPVPATLFGVTINSTTGAMPSFQVGSVRFWDSQTRWANLQPARDRYDWSTLDRLVGAAVAAGTPPLLVLGGTPAWAAPSAKVGPYSDDSRTGPPADLADWDAFVGALVARYAGRIEAYELWVSATDSRFYSGDLATLVEMTRRAATIVRAADPEATVVCPSMGELWTPEGRAVLSRFAELGGYAHCDAAGVKLYQRRPTDPPETMVELLSDIDRIMHAAGVHPPLWNTGTTYEIPLQGTLDARRSIDYAMRFYLAGLYGREYGVARMYFYNWGSGRLPLVLQAEGGPPTEAALAVERLQRWLAGARVTGCGQGEPAGLPGNVWQCRFSDGRTVRWTSEGTAEITAGPGTRTDADGTVTTLTEDERVTVTETPMLITER